jgi:hypothetical protein
VIIAVMRRCRDVLIALPLVTAAVAASAAQSVPSPRRHPLLQRLVGTWRMTGQVRGRAVAYDLSADWVLADRFVELHMIDRASPPQYEARVFIGPDSVEGRILVHWMDSFGASASVPHGSGTAAADTLRFEFAYRDGPLRDTFTYRPADDSWIFRLESGDGRGGWQLFAEYTVRRVDAAGP